MEVGIYSSIEATSSAATGVPGPCSRARGWASTCAREACVRRRFTFCHWHQEEVRDGTGPPDEPEGIPLREVRLRNQSERRASYLSNVSNHRLESTAIRTERSGDGCRVKANRGSGRRSEAGPERADHESRNSARAAGEEE